MRAIVPGIFKKIWVQGYRVDITVTKFKLIRAKVRCIKISTDRDFNRVNSIIATIGQGKDIHAGLHDCDRWIMTAGAPDVIVIPCIRIDFVRKAGKHRIT